LTASYNGPIVVDMGTTRYILTPVGSQDRYGVTDREIGRLVRFKADGRWRMWSNVHRAIAGANALNGFEAYRFGGFNA
jgi:hypothetical protein